MSASDRRAAARRKAWGRGPVILRFEPLEGRALLSDATGLSPDANTSSAPAAEVDPSGTPVTSSPTDLVATTTDTAASSADPNNSSEILMTTAVDPAAMSSTSTPSTTSATDTPTTTSAPETTSIPTLPTTSALKPDLVLSDFSAASNLDWGDSFIATGLVRNTGPGAAPAGVKVDVYASTTPTITSKSVYVGTATVKDAIAPGGQSTFAAELHAPPQAIPGLGTAPSYYLVPKVDLDNVVVETNDANNGGTAGSPARVVTVTPKKEPQLVPTQFLVAPVGGGNPHWGGTLQVSAQITNNQAGTVAPPTRARVVLVPKGQSVDGPNAVTIGELYFPQITAYPPVTRQGTVYLPPTPPAVLAGATQLTVGLIPDADYLTRPPLSPTNVQGDGRDQVTITLASSTPTTPPDQRADLTVTAVQPLTDTLVWSEPFQVKATVANKGATDAEPVRVRFLLVDANRPNDPPLALSDAVVNKLQAGYQQDVTQTINLEGKLPAGRDPSTISGRIVVQVDPEHAINQSNTANDQLTSSPLRLKLLTRDDVVSPTPSTPAPTTSTPPPTTPAPQDPSPTGNGTNTGTGTDTGQGAGTPTTPTPAANRQAALRAQLAQLRQARQQAMALRRAQRPVPVRLRTHNPSLRVLQPNLATRAQVLDPPGPGSQRSA